jgi:sulfotransferase family protein
MTPLPASRLSWFASRLVRHVRWARDQGVRRLIEEDQLNPFERASLGLQKRRWRRSHHIAPMATAVFVVGVQRSGTNMVVRGLERSPEFEVHNENDRVAFDRFQLRPLPVIRDLVMKSGHRYVLFKPLCDSHRTLDLLDELAAPSPGRAIWTYRSPDGRVRSALAKFGGNNLDVLRDIAAGRGLDRWQAQGLSDENRKLVRSYDYSRMTPESAAALFWYVRNSLFFELALHERQDVMLVSYDGMISSPQAVMRSMCGFLGFPFEPQQTAHIENRERPDLPPLELEPGIRARCDELFERLEAAANLSLERSAN